MMTYERAWEILKNHGIESEEELRKELRNNEIEIGMFTKPVDEIRKDA